MYNILKQSVISVSNIYIKHNSISKKLKEINKKLPFDTFL